MLISGTYSTLHQHWVCHMYLCMINGTCSLLSLGRFPLTLHEDEVVFALATDDACQWLLAGDTAGHLSLFNIAQYCTTPPQEVRAICLMRECIDLGIIARTMM